MSEKAVDDDPFGSLALTDGEEAKPLPVGLVTPDAAASDELQTYCKVFREAGPGTGKVIFTSEETGIEEFDEVEAPPGSATSGRAATQAEQWAKIIPDWPTGTRLPTIAEISAWQVYAECKMNAELFYALREFRKSKAAAIPVTAGRSPAETDLEPPQPEPAPPRRGLTA